MNTVRSTTRRASTVSVLDIGTSKMCCMVARCTPIEGRERGRTHAVEVLGIGHQRSAGVRGGSIVDIAAAETAIRRVIDSAEAQAKVAVGSVIVNVSSGALGSQTHEASVKLGGHEVEDGDVSRVLRDAMRRASSRERVTLHSLPVSYALDGTGDIADPRGMVGESLSVSCHVVDGPAGPLRNIERAVNRAHVEVERMVATPYASALAAIVEDEAEMGCAAIDLGAGTTSWAVMSGGRFVYGDAIPVGGQHVTTDLARGLSTSIEQAERLKVLEACVSHMPRTDEPVAIHPLAGDGSAAAAMVPRALVGQIVSARIEETLELVRERIRQSGFGKHADRRIILTGGGAQLSGIADLARRMLAKNVRVGRPVGVSGLAPQQKNPAFSTAVGLSIFPQVAAQERHASTPFALPSTGRFARLGDWFRGF